MWANPVFVLAGDGHVPGRRHRLPWRAPEGPFPADPGIPVTGRFLINRGSGHGTRPIRRLVRCRALDRDFREPVTRDVRHRVTAGFVAVDDAATARIAGDSTLAAAGDSRGGDAPS